MFDERPCLYFDFVDPGSLLVRRRVTALGIDCRMIGFEMRPPPEPMVDPSEPAWIGYWDELSPHLREAGLSASPPRLVPWTRKAHELVLQAEARVEPETLDALRERIWVACLDEGVDIGRIDVLVPFGVEVGLDRTETRAALDVDRWTARLEEARRAAQVSGVRGVPTLAVAEARLEGVHDEDTIRAFVEVG